MDATPKWSDMLVLGCDPGSVTGWALLDVRHTGLAEWIDGGSTKDAMRDKLPIDRADLVAVEISHKVYPRDGFGPRMAGYLGQMNTIGGFIIGLATAAGVRAESIAATEWRKYLCGSPSASNAAIRSVMKLRVSSLPKRTNQHVNDASLLAVYAGMKVQMEKGPRT